MSDLLDGLVELDKHAGAYQRASDYYQGTVNEVMFGSNALSRKLAESGQRYKLNLAKLAVNVIADRLEIAAVTVPNEDALTDVLQQRIWDTNQLTLETPDWNRMACMYGDGYLVVWEGDEEGQVDVWFNSPCTMRVIYDVENPRKKSYAVKSWHEGSGEKKRRRVTLYYPDRIERWITKSSQVSGDRDADWEEYQEDGQPWPIPNPLGEVPVFHLRTNSPYGTPEHKDAYGPQDALNKLVVTLMASVDYAGFPLRYALVEGEAQIEGNAQFAPVWDDDAEAAEGDRNSTNFEAGPGKVWIANGLKGVGQLDPADPKHFLDPAEFLIRAMAQVTTTPLHYFDPSGDVPSGESLRTADAPLVKKIGFRQQRFGATYSEALTFALKVLGLKPAQKVDVRWEPATSSDDQASWVTAKAKIDAGVPVRQVLLESGYVAEQVDEWIATSGEENLRQRVTLLGELGKAVQSLGAGASLGVVSPESVQAAVNAILAGTAGPEQ